MNGATSSPKSSPPRLSASLGKPTIKLSGKPEAADAAPAGKPRAADAPKNLSAADAYEVAKWRAGFDLEFWRVDVPSWGLSFIVHAVLIVALGLFTAAVGGKKWLGPLIGSIDRDLPAPTVDLVEASLAVGGAPSESIEVGLNDIGQDLIDSSPLGADPKKRASEVYAVGIPGLPNALVKEATSMFGAGGVEGRLGDDRRGLAFGEGATEASENAVRRGLEWLKNHQRTDGGWRFNLAGSTSCQCRSAGTASSTTGATGLALMAFLGAGQTHREGEYGPVVQKGVYYLLDRLQPTKHGADLQEGTMYAQGIASIALCEALAMTGDESLRPWAQGAVDFIVYAQDPNGGGWRYVPNQPGDASLHGWQLMALRSGEMGYLTVPPRTLTLASRFLDSVESQRPFGYGYLTPDDGTNATLAIGTLCRMYEGWKRNDMRLYRLVGRISEMGPSADDMYFNYYATQVLHHWGGREWEIWNEKMRDHLVLTQSLQGCESGSWQFDGNQGKVGGRLYNTALAIMTLEVYYRHLPLYRLPNFAPR